MAFLKRPNIKGVEAGTRIGNGSKGDVIIEHRVSKTGQPYVTLVAVKVTDLVDYEDYVKPQSIEEIFDF